MPLGSSTGCLDVLDELVALAACLKIDIRGVLVEDSALSDLAGYRLVTAFSRRIIDAHAIEGMMRQERTTIQHIVEATAGRYRVPVHLEVARWRTAIEVVQSAEDRDLIVLPRSSKGRTMFPGSASSRWVQTIQAAILATRRSLLVVGTPKSLRRRVYAAFDGTPSSTEALEVAATIAASPQSNALVVLLLAADRTEAERLKQRARAHLQAPGVSVSFEVITPNPAKPFWLAIPGHENGLLVLGGETQALLQSGDLQVVPERARCSVLLIR